jgi:hypothetical protein
MLAIYQRISTEKECLRSAEQERILKSKRCIPNPDNFYWIGL